MAKLSDEEVLKVINNIDFRHYRFQYEPKKRLIFASYGTPHGENHTRKYYISPFDSEKDIVEFCLQLVISEEISEIKNAFRFMGESVYPYHTFNTKSIAVSLADPYMAKDNKVLKLHKDKKPRAPRKVTKTHDIIE